MHVHAFLAAFYKRVLISQGKGQCHWAAEEKEGSLSVFKTAGLQTRCISANIYLDPHYCIPAVLFMFLCIRTAACGYASTIWTFILLAVPTQTDLGIPLIDKQSGIIITSALKGNPYPRNWPQRDEGQEKYMAVMWIEITKGRNAHDKDAQWTAASPECNRC